MKDPKGPIMAGVWNRANGKDLVWYPKAEFDKAGYKVPQTWDELMALTEQIAKDGDTAWCVGIGSGAATGWPLTDWVETLMLRTTSLENYDKWVAGELKFDSPEVRNALSYVTKIWFNDKYVYGGRKAIANTQFGILRYRCSTSRPSAGCINRATSSRPSSEGSKSRKRL